MTKVSWKRILQRAGNDLPSHGRPFPESPHLQIPSHAPQRQSRAAESPSMIAGELETELRRALQRAQNAPSSEPEQPAWDPIYQAREMRHNPPAIPVRNYAAMQAKPRSNATRNILAVSLSAVVVGFAVQQIATNWGGGGGGGGGSDEQQQSQNASAVAPENVKHQSRLVETGYAIQPLVHPGNSPDLGATNKDTPSPVSEEKPHASNPGADAAAIFQRDMEEAAKLFENKQPPAPDAGPAPAATAAVTPAPQPAQPAAEAPTASVPPAKVAAATTTPLSELTGEEEDRVLDRASGLMKRGDVAGARQLFEHLARRGSALGAFALAQSYDPNYLKKVNTRGLPGDQKRADYWYRRAAELGTAVR
jgi:hypothetical protein